jgi:hypothetical protein
LLEQVDLGAERIDQFLVLGLASRIDDLVRVGLEVVQLKALAEHLVRRRRVHHPPRRTHYTLDYATARLAGGRGGETIRHFTDREGNGTMKISPAGG